MIRRALGTGVVLLGIGAAGPALAQTAMDVMGAMQMQEEQQAAAGAAAAGTRSIVGAVFGAGQGAAAAAPTEDASAGVAPDLGGEAVASTSPDLPMPSDDLPAGYIDAVPAPYETEPPPLTAAELAAARGRDPFRPFTLDLRPEVTETEVLTPLQRYEIPQLRLAGVVLDLTPPRAMLQDNSGMGFIVTPGTPIGRRRGVVKSIEPGRVVVEERVIDYYGREQVHQVAIDMPKDDKPQSTGQE